MKTLLSKISEFLSKFKRPKPPTNKELADEFFASLTPEKQKSLKAIADILSTR